MAGEMSTYGMGIDIGGSSIKGALVDIENGCVYGEVHVIPTPSEAPAEVVGETVAQLVELCGATEDMPIGIGFPAPVVRGRIPSMANLSPTWVGMDVAEFFTNCVSRPVSVLNDADAAGIAQFSYSHIDSHEQVIVFLTLGTGIGSAIFYDGKLFPNTELGHIHLSSKIQNAEKWAAPSIRTRDNLSLEEWTQRIQLYLSRVEDLFNPDSFILGGGISEHFDTFSKWLTTGATLLPAALRNHAGIVGAARYAYDARA
ncbi:MAG: ROK family protein [Actinomycetaceae bacterium]|nr:ROK family protein [Actinomycetaceae bacterium]